MVEVSESRECGDGRKVLETMALVHICWGFYIFNLVDLFFWVLLFPSFLWEVAMSDNFVRPSLSKGMVYLDTLLSTLIRSLHSSAHTMRLLLSTRQQSKVRNQFDFTTRFQSWMPHLFPSILTFFVFHTLNLNPSSSNRLWNIPENLCSLSMFTLKNQPLWQIRKRCCENGV